MYIWGLGFMRIRSSLHGRFLLWKCFTQNAHWRGLVCMYSTEVKTCKRPARASYSSTLTSTSCWCPLPPAQELSHPVPVVYVEEFLLVWVVGRNHIPYWHSYYPTIDIERLRWMWPTGTSLKGKQGPSDIWVGFQIHEWNFFHCVSGGMSDRVHTHADIWAGIPFSLSDNTVIVHMYNWFWSTVQLSEI